MTKALNVFGLFSKLAGILLLFAFEMPVRIAAGSQTVAWTTENLALQVKKFDNLYHALGWIGLLAIVFGTLLQMWATVEQ